MLSCIIVIENIFDIAYRIEVRVLNELLLISCGYLWIENKASSPFNVVCRGSALCRIRQRFIVDPNIKWSSSPVNSCSFRLSITDSWHIQSHMITFISWKWKPINECQCVCMQESLLLGNELCSAEYEGLSKNVGRSWQQGGGLVVNMAWNWNFFAAAWGSLSFSKHY